VLGPLIIAGVAIEEEKIRQLSDLGVKDSKLLTPKKRSLLFKEIKKLASSIRYEKIQPRFIDEVVIRGERLHRLNYLEARYMARILARLDFEKAYVDCCDTKQDRFGALVADLLLEEQARLSRLKDGGRSSNGIFVNLGAENPLRRRIISEHHADRNYPAVSAASIIAKVKRDAAIRRLYMIHGPFGSGYPSDPETVQFLREFISSSKNLPEFTRLSWATIARVHAEEKVTLIEDFAKTA